MIGEMVYSLTINLKLWIKLWIKLWNLEFVILRYEIFSPTTGKK